MDAMIKAERLAERAREFREEGAISLKAVIAPSTVEVLREAFMSRCSAYLSDGPHPDALKVGDRRFMITPTFEPPFSDPAVFASGEAIPLLRELLGKDCILGSFGAVVSLAGAAAQHRHRDFSEQLFPGTPLEPMVPPYAITLIVPLIDVDETTGTTLLWPGSHRQRRPQDEYPLEGAVWPRLSAGDGLLIDYRLVHAGSANHSQAPRPILYLTYCRPWFRDHVNYQLQPRLRLSASGLPELPEQLAHLFPPFG